jgi:hypothetical protein
MEQTNFGFVDRRSLVGKPLGRLGYMRGSLPPCGFPRNNLLSLALCLAGRIVRLSEPITTA